MSGLWCRLDKSCSFPRRLQSTAVPQANSALLSRLEPSDIVQLVTRLCPLALRAHEKHSQLRSLQESSSLSTADVANLRQLSKVSRVTETLLSIRHELDDIISLQEDPASDDELLILARDERQRLNDLARDTGTELLSVLLAFDSNTAAKDLAEEGFHDSVDESTGDKCVLLEVRAGTGGDEAALFAAELVEMYAALSRRLNWQLRTISRSSTDLKGVREAVMRISGFDVYSTLSTEAGVHRVQRVPATETQGRLHTSTASVAVLRDSPARRVSLRPSDVRIDVYRASGAGGQHVNTTESAVRATHIPTGIVATCQDERSQHRNRAVALETLAVKVAAKVEAEGAARRVGERRAQLGSTAGERSDRIRTYNFPQRRVTDHRIIPHARVAAVAPGVKEAIGDKSVSLQQVMEGGKQLGELMEAVRRAWEVEKLGSLLEDADKERSEASTVFSKVFVTDGAQRQKQS